MFWRFWIFELFFEASATQSCRDHPFFYGLCSYQVCSYENAQRYCPVTCGQCRSFVGTSINYVDTEIKLQNECSPQISQAMRCEYKCAINYGSPVCVCPKGYQLTGYSCRDINECLSSSSNACESYQSCINTEGGYYCEDNLNEKCTGKEGKCGAVDQNNIAGKYFSSENGFEFPWLVVISGQVDRKLVSCLGAAISDGSYVIADLACTGNMKTTSMSVYRLSDKKRLYVSFAYNSQEFDVFLVKLTQPIPGMPSCMPEGENFNQFSQCVSVQLDNKQSFKMNSEYLMSSQTSCDTLSRKFTQLFYKQLPGAICSGDSDVDSTCSISKSQSALFCKRCDSCSWSLAGFGKFTGTCSGSKFVSGFSSVEIAEKWVRSFTPYGYSHRQKKCSLDHCCEKFSIEGKVFQKQAGSYYKTSASEFLFNLKGVWANGMSLSGLSQSSYCPEDAAWINPFGKKKITSKARCQAAQKYSPWSEWSSCDCKYGAIGRQRTCRKLGTCAEERLFELKKGSKESCKSLNCPKCCNVIKFNVPNIKLTDAIRPRTESLNFHLTKNLQQSRPIYKTSDGKYFLTYTTGFWVVTNKIGSFDFFYFIEDSAFCPTDVRTGGWEIMGAGMNSASDNRISTDCMEIPFADESTPVLTQTIAPPAQEKIAGCCAKVTLSATGIDSPIPSISEFHYDPSKPDAKNYNGPSGYKVYPYATGTDEYFVFGEGTSVSNAACFSKRLKKTECLDDESLTWQCKSGGQWMDAATVKFSCKMETTTTPKSVITTSKTTKTTTTSTRKTTTKPSTPKTTKKIAISYTTPKPTTPSKILSIQPDQCYSSNGCCCVLQITGHLTGIFTKDEEDNYNSEDQSLKLSRNDNYWVIRQNGKNMYYVKDNGKNDCPNLTSMSWKRKSEKDSGWVDTTIGITCKTPENHKNSPSKSTTTNSEFKNSETFDHNSYDYEAQEFPTTTTLDFTTTTATTMTTTLWDEAVQPWAPWSKCSSTCGGVQSRKRHDDEIATQWKPCGASCPTYSPWYEWSPCSEWCGFGVQRRRRVCTLDGKPSEGCNDGSAFEKKACYEQDCPLVSKLSNCCMFISLSGSGGPLDGSYKISGGNNEGIIYEHFDGGFEIYKQQRKWHVGKPLKSLADAPLAALTIFGGSGVDNCPTSVKNWKVPTLTDGQLILQDKNSLELFCGTSWSEWSRTCDRTKCGDDIRSRSKQDKNGKTITDQQNCGLPCEKCVDEGSHALCKVFERSGYCVRSEMRAFMKTNCPASCCVFTGNLTFQ